MSRKECFNKYTTWNGNSVFFLGMDETNSTDLVDSDR